MERGLAVAGSPDTVTAFLLDQVRESSVDYLIGQFAYGHQTPDECLRTVELFARDVMPALRAAVG